MRVIVGWLPSAVKSRTYTTIWYVRWLRCMFEQYSSLTQALLLQFFGWNVFAQMKRLNVTTVGRQQATNRPAWLFEKLNSTHSQNSNERNYTVCTEQTVLERIFKCCSTWGNCQLNGRTKVISFPLNLLIVSCDRAGMVHVFATFSNRSTNCARRFVLELILCCE